MRQITTHEFEFTNDFIETLLVDKALNNLVDRNKDNYTIVVETNEGITTVRLSKSEIIVTDITPIPDKGSKKRK